MIEIIRSIARAAERARQAIELAERHSWTDEPTAGTAYVMLGGALVWQWRPEEADPWVQRAERTVRAEAERAEAMAVYFFHGLLKVARGRDADALAAFRAAERVAGNLAVPHYLALPTQAWLLEALVRLGETERAEQALADLGEQCRTAGYPHSRGGAAARPR
jgi:LuxR family transcriptional regulator, maltose regulon positive regulatory protein